MHLIVGWPRSNTVQIIRVALTHHCILACFLCNHATFFIINCRATIMENIIKQFFQKTVTEDACWWRAAAHPKSFNLGMKILKATNYTMGVPLSISTYLGPQLVEHIRLSLIIESKSKQFHSRYLQIITSLPYPTHIYTPITSCSEEATSLLLIKQDHPMKSFLHKYWEMLHTYDLRQPETNWEMTQ
jgi:hypothetical protein